MAESGVGPYRPLIVFASPLSHMVRTPEGVVRRNIYVMECVHCGKTIYRALDECIVNIPLCDRECFEAFERWERETFGG